MCANLNVSRERCVQHEQQVLKSSCAKKKWNALYVALHVAGGFGNIQLQLWTTLQIIVSAVDETNFWVPIGLQLPGFNRKILQFAKYEPTSGAINAVWWWDFILSVFNNKKTILSKRAKVIILHCGCFLHWVNMRSHTIKVCSGWFLTAFNHCMKFLMFWGDNVPPLALISRTFYDGTARNFLHHWRMFSKRQLQTADKLIIQRGTLCCFR